MKKQPPKSLFAQFVMAACLYSILAYGAIADATDEPDDPEDWDAATVVANGLPYWRNGQPLWTSRKMIYVTTNINQGCARVETDDPVPHIHYDKDYWGDCNDSPGKATYCEGNTFWEKFYENYTPAITRLNNCLGQDNCYCAAYDGYCEIADETIAAYWINPPDAHRYRDALHRIADFLENGDFDTIAGDRCDSEEDPDPTKGGHVWVIVASPSGQPASSISWKNHSSPNMLWQFTDPDDNTNCAPSAGFATEFYEKFGIFNVEDR